MAIKKILYTFGGLTLFIVLTVLILGIYRFNFTNGGDIIPGDNAPDVRNMSYVIDSETFTLQNGVSVSDAAPGSSSKNTVRIFGEPLYQDFNGDTVQDAALLLLKTTPGSGAFYYAVLVVAKNNQYTATNALFLGDRIAPQNINVDNGTVIYNYAERRADEPMTTSPSVGKSLYVIYNPATHTITEK